MKEVEVTNVLSPAQHITWLIAAYSEWRDSKPAGLRRLIIVASRGRG